MSTDYGIDCDTSSDLGFSPVKGTEALKQALLRSLQDGDAGIDLYDWLNEDMDETQVFDLQQSIASQLQKDERIDSVTVSVTQPSPASLAIDIDVIPSTQDEPFVLTLGVPDLTVPLLSAGATS
jgi:hypothetical protein